MRAIEAGRSSEIRTAKDGQKIALLGVQVDAKVTGLVERTTVTQSFRNDEDEAIEVTYTFPLPDDAAVCGFEVITEGRVLTGQAKARDQAVEEYDDAITEGDGAFLLESHRRDVFTVNVGNINPGQLAVLRIDYVRMLKQVDGEVSLHFPTTVPPRYVTTSGAANATAALNDGEMINPPRLPDGASLVYGVVLNVSFGDGLVVTAANSVTHELAPAFESGQKSSARQRFVQQEPVQQLSRLHLASGQVAMDRDVVIDLTLRDSEAPVSVSEVWQGQQHAAVSFMPDFSLIAAGGEWEDSSSVVFVLDCSGSMGGQSIEQAKRALELCLRSLKAGDSFNIVRFGSSHEVFAKAMVDYNAATLKKALAWLARSGATMGGTELLAPMQAVYQWLPSNGLGSMGSMGSKGSIDIVLLTDGQVSNEMAVRNLAKDHAATHRVFAFGLGAAAGRSLLNGLAEASGGAVEYIANSERVEEKVLRTFCRIASPLLSDLRLETPEGFEASLAEKRVPVLFDGDAACLLMRIRGKIPQQGIVFNLTAKCGDQSLSWPVQIDAPVELESVAQSIVSVAWANQRIRYMESAIKGYAGDFAAPGAGAGAKGERQRKRALNQIVQMATEFNLLCDHTAFVAVEHRSVAERNDGMPAQREVPVMLPEGHGESEHLEMPAFLRRMNDTGSFDMQKSKSIETVVSHCFSPSVKASASSNLSDDFSLMPDRLPGKRRRKRKPTPSRAMEKRIATGVNADVDPDATPQTRQQRIDHVFDILQLQQSDGSFVGINRAQDYFSAFEDVLHRMDSLGNNNPDFDKIVETLFVLMRLEAEYLSERSLWKRAAAKARSYLLGAGIGEELIEHTKSEDFFDVEVLVVN